MKLKKPLYIAALAALASGSAYAAVQGTTGQTSTGSLDVTVQVTEEVKVSNLGDIALGTYVPGGGDLIGSDAFCIYYNNDHQFNLEMRSANSAGPGFQAANGGNFVPYTVEFSEDFDGAGTYAAVTEALATNYAGDATSDANDNCVTLGGDNMSVRVTVTDTGSPLGVPNGVYTDTLTMILQPQP